MGLAEEINIIIEQMPEKKQAVLLELVKTIEDIADIKQAREAFARGEYATHEEVWG